MTNANLLKTVLILSLAAMMTACGSNQQASGTNDLSSRSNTTSGTDAANKAVASCNQGSGSGIGVKLKSYTNAAGALDMSYVWVKMATLPSGFSSNTSSISFFKWLGNPTGSTYLDPAKLNFVIQDPTTGQYLLSTWTTSLKWSDVSTTAQSIGITDAQTFFNRVNILVYLNDAQGAYDVLKVASYTSSSTAVASQMDILLPPYSANPAAYATEADGSARNSALQSLHPFKSMTSQGWTTAQYQSMAQSFCF
ncbi:hypothetical protein [Bdellovibrio svalbardensis]|uniref:Lipoprotein n=1 Tax=Bdellovibrio svalbardensis TaxID=2972972 RepID=A0ABT6DLN0_9BACT|nr:hypothetical protein [Bdellovibrio svalbardensis]MDG0817782.1 hypothetical protein [Bdellovibrio svalbardensis]